MKTNDLSVEFEKPTPWKRFWGGSFVRVMKYTLSRMFTILLTIILGIFITVMIANKGGFIDDSVRNSVEATIRVGLYSGAIYKEYGQEENPVQAAREYLTEQFGLNLPQPQRNLRWTLNCLTFNWGDILDKSNLSLRASNPLLRSYYRYQVLAVLLDHFPNTLLLITIANLIVFLLGIPTALFLSRHYGSWLDKLLVALSPVSSIPSWVHGIFLVIIFGVQLKWLPVAGMLDFAVPNSTFERFLAILKHAILPVTAIILSMFFQYIYTWRAYFLIHTNDDYVEFARAKGLPERILEKRYILRPAMPYIITSIALMLLGFWQMTTALEYFFRWPGIGLLYVEALGVNVTEIRTVDAVLVIAVVVLFAYLMGLTILLLDVFYAILDPQVKIGGIGQLVKPFKAKKAKTAEKDRSGEEKVVLAHSLLSTIQERNLQSSTTSAGTVAKAFAQSRKSLHKERWSRVTAFLREVLRYPSIVAGLVMVTFLVAVAIYAMLAYSPSRIHKLWYPQMLGRYYTPKNARPAWFNWFRNKDYPSTVLLDSRNGTATKTVELEETRSSITLFYSFDYSAGDFPEDIVIYFYPTYKEKMPYATLTWIRPNGKEIRLEGMGVTPGEKYRLSEYSSSKFVIQDIIIQGSQGGSPPIYEFFMNPGSDVEEVVKGTYTLRIDCSTFEPGSDLDAEVVLLGKIYGLAGTDHLRRDLIVALLYGLPIALALGLVGAVVTTCLSMLVASAGTWFGGWVDTLIQRLTEANMILPILAIGVLVYYFYGISLWTIIGVVILLNVFGSTTKTYRAALLQIKESPYIEAAQSYGAGSGRIILHYLVPRILPVMVPQLVALIPFYVFLEATLGIFGVGDPSIPTWGRIIYDAIKNGAFSGNYYWIAEPIVLLLFTGLAFAMFGFALDKVLNPRLRDI